MKLYVEQAVFTWADRFSIYDELGNEVYYAEDENFTIGHKVRVYKYGMEIGYIKQEIFNFMPTFEMELRGEALGSIVKRLSFLSQKYDLEYKGWYVDGDCFAFNYTVYDENDLAVMQISKEILTWGDCYCLDILDDRYEEICVMILLAIDCAMCND